MDAKKLNRLKKTLPEGFADTVEAAQNDELKRTVSQLALYIEKVEEERDTNETISALKNQLMELRGPFTDTIKVLKAKIRFIYLLLESRGVQ